MTFEMLDEKGNDEKPSNALSECPKVPELLYAELASEVKACGV